MRLVVELTRIRRLCFPRTSNKCAENDTFSQVSRGSTSKRVIISKQEVTVSVPMEIFSCSAGYGWRSSHAQAEEFEAVFVSRQRYYIELEFVLLQL